MLRCVLIIRLPTTEERSKGDGCKEREELFDEESAVGYSWLCTWHRTHRCDCAVEYKESSESAAIQRVLE